jgi:phosphohistidine phosphatase
MRLYFLRHAEAEDYREDDFNRQLTERGRQRTRTAALVLHKLNIGLTHIITSPRVRARQTAEIVGEVFGMDIIERQEVDIGFNIEYLKRLIGELDEDDRPVFIGHNPSMSQVVGGISGAHVNLKKGGFARLDISTEEPLFGELVWLIAPKVFDTLGGD